MSPRSFSALPAIALLVVGGCGLGGEERTMSGQVVAPECGGGYEVESAQITLRNESDEIIGTATTSDNRLDVTAVAKVCVVDFRLGDIPDAKFYTLKIGSHEGPAWSKAELEKQKFKPQLTLGDAVLPTGSTADVCSELDTLQTLLNNTDLLNSDASAWSSQINGYGARLAESAAALDLADKDPVAQAVDDLASAVSLFSYDGYSPIKTLNREVAPINQGAVGITTLSSCLYESTTYD